MSDVHRDDTMFRPPVNRAMKVLDRNFFKVETAISAARVFDIKQLSRIRGAILKSKDILDVRQLHPIQSVPAALKSEMTTAKDGEQKCILLRPGVVHDGLFVKFPGR
jgi:tRNA (guanine37-N1)-methyltransferase